MLTPLGQISGADYFRLPVSVVPSTDSSTRRDSVFFEITNKCVLADSSVGRAFLNGVCRPLNQGRETQ